MLTLYRVAAVTPAVVSGNVTPVNAKYIIRIIIV